MGKRGLFFIFIILAIASVVAQSHTTQNGPFDAEGRVLVILDSDGDYVVDSADDCEDTEAQDTVDRVGCSDAQRQQSFQVTIGEGAKTTGVVPFGVNFFLAYEGGQHILYVPDQDGEANPIEEGSEVDVQGTELTINEIELEADSVTYDISWESPSAGITDCSTVRLAAYAPLDESRMLSGPRCYQLEQGIQIIYERLITCAGTVADGPYSSDADICKLKSIGEACNADTECSSGTCRQTCVEVQRELGGSCDVNRPCAQGQCIDGSCYKISPLGGPCDPNTICEQGGCDTSTNTCVEFFGTSPRIEIASLYEQSEEGMKFPLLDDTFAWINIYDNGRFDFSVIVYNGIIDSRSREPHEHPTHVIYTDGLASETVNAVSLRAVLTSIAFVTSPIQPLLTSISESSRALGLDLPDALSAVTRYRNARQFLQQLISAEDVAIIIELSSQQTNLGYELSGSVRVDGSIELYRATGILEGPQTLEPLELQFTNNRATFDTIVPQAGQYTVRLTELHTPLGKLNSDSSARLSIQDDALIIE